MKKNNGSLPCDVCKESPVEYVAINVHAPVVKDDFGIGRIALFLCKVCATGAFGAGLLAIGAEMFQLLR